MLTKDLISEDISTLKTSDTAEVALNLMDDLKVCHLPIVNTTQFLGLISEKDIFELNNIQEPIGNHKLSLFAPFVHGHQHFFDAIEVATRLELSIVPVLNEKEEYLGSIPVHTLLAKAAEQLNTNGPGGLIVLEIPKHDYVLSEIARIVEGENAKILSFTTSIRPNGNLFITLKINTENINSILRSLERFNYHIYTFFTNSCEENEAFQKRLNEFLHYLQI